MQPKHLAFAAALSLGILVDQATKAWARATDVFQVGDGHAVHPMLLHLVHRENPGAAFSLLAGLPENLRVPLFLAFNAIAAVIAVRILLRLPAHKAWTALWTGTFLAGALGNAIDRVMKATVTDFIRFHVDYEPVYSWLMHLFGRADWPVFNVADGLLFIGVIGVVLTDRDAPPPREAPDAAAP